MRGVNADISVVLIGECVRGLLLCSPRGELIEVRRVKYNRMRAKVLFPVSAPPVFREYGPDMVQLLTEPSPALMRRYRATVRRSLSN